MGGASLIRANGCATARTGREPWGGGVIITVQAAPGMTCRVGDGRLGDTKQGCFSLDAHVHNSRGQCGRSLRGRFANASPHPRQGIRKRSAQQSSRGARGPGAGGRRGQRKLPRPRLGDMQPEPPERRLFSSVGQSSLLQACETEKTTREERAVPAGRAAGRICLMQGSGAACEPSQHWGAWNPL